VKNNKQYNNKQDSKKHNSKINRLAYALGVIAAKLYAQGKLPIAAEEMAEEVSGETEEEQPVVLPSQEERPLCE
jgi:hypothetical protein